MDIIITRRHFLPNCTIGTLEVVFQKLPVLPIYVCDTLEPHTIDWSKETKVHGKTAIPCGEYDIEFRFSKKFVGNMPYLKDVPNFEGVMIHKGNAPKDTKGCILVGVNCHNEKGEPLPRLINSKIKYDLLWKMIVQARKKNEHIKVIIKEDRRFF